MSKFIQGPRKDDMVYVEDGEIKGSLTLSGDTVYNVWVRPRYRRQGVGTRMMELLELVALRFEVPTLKLSVKADNVPAMRMYHKLGYAMVPTSVTMKKEVNGVQKESEGESENVPPFLP